MDTIRFFVQPWNKYNSEQLPTQAVAGADYVWIEGLAPDPSAVYEEVRHRSEGKTGEWIGTCAHRMPGCDTNDAQAWIVDCDGNHHSSVLPIALQIQTIIEELGGIVLTWSGGH